MVWFPAKEFLVVFGKNLGFGSPVSANYGDLVPVARRNPRSGNSQPAIWGTNPAVSPEGGYQIGDLGIAGYQISSSCRRFRAKRYQTWRSCHVGGRAIPNLEILPCRRVRAVPNWPFCQKVGVREGARYQTLSFCPNSGALFPRSGHPARPIEQNCHCGN